MVERGDPPKLHLSIPGPIRKAAEPMPRLQPVQGVAVQHQIGDVAWSISWQAVPGASGYEIQTNPDPIRLIRWFARGRVSGAATQIRLHGIGSRVWVRVRALGTAGAGPWSDPILLCKNESAVQQAA
jgi:hypothetical protein